MIVELPSGPKVTLRDKLTAKDKFAVQASVTLALDTQTGMQNTAFGMVNEMANALLIRLIEDWDVPGKSIPSQDPDALGELDLDDYNALLDAVEPMMRKVLNTNPNRTRPSTS